MSIKTKMETALLVFVLGVFLTGGIKAIQTQAKVEEHSEQIKVMSQKMGQISDDVSFIRGRMEKGH